MTSSHEPIACSLTAQDARAQALEWADLQQIARRTATLPAGATMVFSVDEAPRVADLVDRERACCSFLQIATSSEGDEFVVEITAANPDALSVIDALSGVVRP